MGDDVSPASGTVAGSASRSWQQSRQLPAVSSQPSVTPFLSFDERDNHNKRDHTCTHQQPPQKLI